MTSTAGLRRVRAMTGAAAIIAALTYSAFLIGPLWQSRLRIADSFPSELEAAGQPHAMWFRLADAVSGILVVASVYAAYRLCDLGLGWVGAACIAAVGLASITDALTTMGCAPSLSYACRAKDTTVNGLLSQALEAHTLSGFVGFAGAVVGMVLVGLDLRSRWRSWARASRTLGLVLAAVALADLVLLVTDGPFGYVERARDVVVSLWLVGLAALALSTAITGRDAEVAPGMAADQPVLDVKCR